MIDSENWGNDGYPAASPIASDPQPVTGERLPNGNLCCHGCGGEIPDNSGQGLKPSCPNCWAAVDVIASPPAPNINDPKERSRSDDWRRFVPASF